MKKFKKRINKKRELTFYPRKNEAQFFFLNTLTQNFFAILEILITNSAADY